MVMQNKDEAAKYIYMAQLEAQKGGCQCKVCQLTRKATTAMIDQELADNNTPPAAADVVEVPAGGDGRPAPDQQGG